MIQPPQPKLGYAEYCLIPEDGLRHEIIDGVPYVNPAPNTYHQTISKRLQYQLYTLIELTGLGIVFNAPIDLQLSDHDIVQPDLLAMRADQSHIILPAKIEGTPELLVEILSASNTKHDRRRKFDLYCRSGAIEFWIVDPEEHLLDQFVLRHGQYQLIGQHDSYFRSHAFPSVNVDLTKVW